MVEDSLKISQFASMQKHSLNACIASNALRRNYTVPPPTSTSGLAVDANRFNDVLGEGQRRQFTEVGGNRLEAERRVGVDILQ